MPPVRTESGLPRHRPAGAASLVPKAFVEGAALTGVKG